MNYFKLLNFPLKSTEIPVGLRFQLASVTINFTDNRDYRAVLYSMGGASGLGIRGGGLRWRLVIPAGRGSSPWDLLPVTVDTDQTLADTAGFSLGFKFVARLTMRCAQDFISCCCAVRLCCWLETQS